MGILHPFPFLYLLEVFGNILIWQLSVYDKYDASGEFTKSDSGDISTMCVCAFARRVCFVIGVVGRIYDS